MVLKKQPYKKEDIDLWQESIRSIAENTLGGIALKPLNELLRWLTEYESNSNSFFKALEKNHDKPDNIRILHEHIQFRKKILEGLNQWIPEKPITKQNNHFEAYDTSFGQFLDQQPELLVKPQDIARFNRLPNDPMKIVFFKGLKRTGYFFYALPIKTYNYFRKLIKKPEYPLPIWYQNIPVKKMGRWYYHCRLLANYKLLADRIYKETVLLAKKFADSDHAFFLTFNDYVSGKTSIAILLEKNKEQLEAVMVTLKTEATILQERSARGLNEIINEVSKQFNQNLEIAGTLEFKSFAHRNRKLKRLTNTINKEFASNIHRRNNALFALADDLKFEQEIYILKANARRSQLIFEARLKAKSDTVAKAITKIPDFIKQVRKEIEEAPADELKKSLQMLKHNSLKSLSEKIIPDISEHLLEQGFLIVIDEAEQSYQSELKFLSKKRILIENFDPAKAYSDKAMHHINPLELIEFEMLAAVRKAFLNAKSQTIETLENTTRELDNMGRMVIFNLDSAIAIIDQSKEDAKETAFQEAMAAMERAIENADLLKNSFSRFSSQIESELHLTTNNFSGKLTELTDQSRVSDLRYRLTKARALKRSAQIGLLFKKLFNEVFLQSKLYYRFSKKHIGTSIDALKSQLGIHQIPSEISSEISDFLVSGSSLAEKLPFVYRRLFENEPLRETTFYHRRDEESAKLGNAWKKWQTGSFTPTLIYGEKGSGISTFINLFVKEVIGNNPAVYSILPVQRILNEEELMKLLGLSLRGQAYSNIKEFYDYVETQPPFVACFDKLHMLFLRTPGGFNLLKKFFEIISNTSKKIFWICTCGMYSSVYLHKSIGLFDYFPVLIPLQKLEIQEIRTIVMLRHKASGYGLTFKPSVFDQANKNFAKKDAVQKQEYLKEKYYTALNNNTQSNISFALQLWIRSAEKPEGNHIMINSLDKINFGFVFNLPAEVIFGLHALILHEKLDVFQLSQVLSTSKRQAYLLLMRLSDRGIVIGENGRYAIHPLLYRQTISLLKDKNLIH